MNRAMDSAEKKFDFKRLIGELSTAYRTETHIRPNFSPIKHLASLYPHVRIHEDPAEKETLSKLYDKRALELWQERIDATDRPVRNPKFNRTEYLLAIDKAVHNFPFTSEETCDKLLAMLLDKRKQDIK